MRILVVEQGQGQGTAVAAELRDAGHEVRTCFGEHTWPCAALTEEGCPIEQAGGVDAVVAVRPAGGTPTAVEAGLTCALRRHLPVVVVGDPGPLADRPEVTRSDRDVVAATEAAATGPQPVHSAVALAELERLLAAHGVTGAVPRAVVHRRAGRLKVTLATGVPVDQHTADTIAVRVTGELRALDPHVDGVDVEVVEDA